MYTSVQIPVNFRGRRCCFWLMIQHSENDWYIFLPNLNATGCYRPDNTTRYWDGYSLIAKAIAASGRDIILACEAMMYMEHDGCSHSSPADPKCAKNFSAGGPERLAAYRRLLAPGQCNSMTVKLDDVQNYFLPADPLGPSADDGSVSGILDFFGDNQDVLASQVKAAGPGHYNDPVRNVLASLSVLQVASQSRHGTRGALLRRHFLARL